MDTDVASEFLKAASEGQLERLKQLVTGVDHNETSPGACGMVRDEDGMTALHYAAVAGKTHICKNLIEQLNWDVDTKNERGDTALSLAIVAGQLRTANYLVCCHANVKESNLFGITPLHWAAIKGHKKLMQRLILEGADVDAAGLYGSPLHFASFFGRKGSVRILLDNKSNPNAASEIFTPLEFCLMSRSFECLEMMLKAGADPDVGFGGRPPLHTAVLKFETEFVELLLREGANPNAVDITGLTPVEVAALVGNKECMGILFPVTSRISSVLEWSIQGIKNHVVSNEARVKIKAMESFVVAKQRGDEAFEKNDYWSAISGYSEALCLCPNGASVLLNRSLCWARMKVGECALSDAFNCVLLKPDWSRAYYAGGIAFLVLKDYSTAVEAFSQALSLDPGDAEIRKCLGEAVEAELAARLAEDVSL